MRWFSALLVIALAGLPCSAQVAVVDGPTDLAPVLAPPAPINPDPCLKFDVNYLYWFLRPMSVPPLLTTGTPNAAGVVGAVGDPGTTILYGNGQVKPRFDRNIGIQLRGSVWLDDLQTWGVHASAFFLERGSSNFTLRHGAVTPLARPYVDALTGTQQAVLVGGDIPGFGPGLGGFNAYTRNELFGQDVNSMAALVQTPDCHINWLLGARFLQLRERLDITATTKIGPDLDGVLGQTDHIHTSNHFYGLQTGFLGDVRLWNRLSLSAKATIALGDNHLEVQNKGDRTIDTPATGRVMVPYGLYVLPSNTGTFRDEKFNIVYEFSTALNWQLSRKWVARVGYSFLSWNDPIRPGQQITAVNLTQVLPGGGTPVPLPTVPFGRSWLWVQGVLAGLEFQW